MRMSAPGSIERAIAETDRRRNKQIEFNAAHGITPRTIVKAVADVMEGARSVQENERYGFRRGGRDAGAGAGGEAHQEARS